MSKRILGFSQEGKQSMWNFTSLRFMREVELKSCCASAENRALPWIVSEANNLNLRLLMFYENRLWSGQEDLTCTLQSMRFHHNSCLLFLFENLVQEHVWFISVFTLHLYDFYLIIHNVKNKWKDASLLINILIYTFNTRFSAGDWRFSNCSNILITLKFSSPDKLTVQWKNI